MFGNEVFTLERFKAIINSEEDLNRFKVILKRQRAKMNREWQQKMDRDRELLAEQIRAENLKNKDKTEERKAEEPTADLEDDEEKED